MNKDKELFSVGKIVGFVGIKGMARVAVTDGRQEAFMQLEKVFIQDEEKLIPLNIESLNLQKNIIRVKFKEFNSIDDVMEYKGCILLAREASVRKTLKPGEYLVSDLVGMMVYDTDGNRIGFVKNIMFNGAQDILSIENEFGKISLVPFVDELVPEVNLDDNSVVVKLIDGLIEQ